MKQYVTLYTDLELNTPFKVTIENVHIVLYKTETGIYALADTCSHEEYPLSESTAIADTIECKKHGSTFNLTTGQAITLPAFEPVQTYSISIDGDKIYVEI